MTTPLTKFITRHQEIAAGEAQPLGLPCFSRYAIAGLEAGAGKTSLAFNLSYLAEDILVIDTCYQCRLTELYTRGSKPRKPREFAPVLTSRFSVDAYPTVYNLLCGSHIKIHDFTSFLPKKVRRDAFYDNQDLQNPFVGRKLRSVEEQYVREISATHESFQGHRAFYIPSDVRMTLCTGKAQDSPDSAYCNPEEIVSKTLYATWTKRCLIDAPSVLLEPADFAWQASEALIVPVKATCQSMDALTLMLEVFRAKKQNFELYRKASEKPPLIQLIVLTHGKWSTSKSARYKPDALTQSIAEFVLELIARYKELFTEGNPMEHLVILDYFGSAGTMQSQGRPIESIQPGETSSQDRKRLEASAGIVKIQNQIKHLHKSIWGLVKESSSASLHPSFNL